MKPYEYHRVSDRWYELHRWSVAIGLALATALGLGLIYAGCW